MAKNQITKKQHFVPRFYLKQFADKDNKLHCYDKSTGKLYSAHAEDICFEKYLYETKWEYSIDNKVPFLSPNMIENLLCEQEARYSQVLPVIMGKCMDNVDTGALICTTEEKKTLASMVANFVLRNPYVAELTPGDEQIQQYLNSDSEMSAINELLECLNMGTIKPFIESSHKKVYLDPNENGVATIFEEKIMQLNLSFLVTESTEFISSSCPVGVYCEDDKIVMVHIPLCPKVMVVYSSNKNTRKVRNRVCKAGKSVVGQYNEYYYKWEPSTLLFGSKDEYVNIYKRLKQNEVTK